MRMAEQHPTVKQYLDRFGAGLSRLPVAEREESVREIASHISEAMAAGQPVADVLEKLGPADRLARAYTADALLRPGEGSRTMRWLAVIGLLATTSLPSLILIPLLSGLGVGFGLGGTATVLIALLALIFPGMAESTLALPYPFPEVLAAVMGVVLAGLGVLALLALRLYLKFLISAIRRVLAA